jgi:acetyl-CoA carboxylase carboxyl transferase subunit beta
MPWFKRDKAGIRTDTKEKIEAPDGLWVKCPACKKPTHIKELILNSHVCPYCGYHYKIGSENYFSILFDNNTYAELDAELTSADPLNFVDSIPYKQRVEQVQKKTNLKDAVRSATGKIGNIDATLACMDFSFIGGSMGSVVGEKIARATDHAMAKRQPLIIISKSGGARMMEGALSLMQMAKTSAHLALLHQAKLPYISVLTDPTTGGVTASYAMLGDFNIAEPKSLIGFAGPRVIRETIGKELPAGFQSAEFLLAHGFIDFIVERKQLKQKITTLLEMLKPW